MPSINYPKVPTASEQIKTTIIIIVLFLVGFFALNFDLGFSPDTKRYLIRAGGYVILAGGLLGGFGFLWNKKNKVKLTLAQQDFNAHTRAIDELNVNAKQPGSSLQPSIDTLVAELNAAEKAITEATSFEDTVAKVGIFSLCLLAIGTVLQVLAA